MKSMYKTLSGIGLSFFLSAALLMITCPALLASSGTEPQNDTTVYVVADQAPQFVGKLNEWLGTHVTYPEEAQEAKIEGRVYVTFVVEKDGSVNQVTIVRGVHPSLDAEAIRVFSAMPKWSPALLEGKAVRFSQTFPLTFKLEEVAEEEGEVTGETPEFTYQMYLENLGKEKEMLDRGEGILSPGEQAQRVELLKKQIGSDKEVFDQMLQQAFSLKALIAEQVKEDGKKLKLKKSELKKLEEIYNGEIDDKIREIRQMGEDDFIKKFVSGEYNLRKIEMHKVMMIRELLGDRFELYFKHHVLGE